MTASAEGGPPRRFRISAGSPKDAAAYWNFIEATEGDRAALKAFAEAQYPPLSVADAQGITHSVLIVSGGNDRVLISSPRKASALGNARYLEVAGADHFSLAADEIVQDAVADFPDAPNA